MALNIDTATQALRENAELGSTGKCAKYVRQALEAGGLDMTSHPLSAKEYGPYLLLKGFTEIPSQGYMPQKGDIIVIQNYARGDVNGHIAMYDGTNWISDFVQRDFWGGPGYRATMPSFKVYRP